MMVCCQIVALNIKLLIFNIVCFEHIVCFEQSFKIKNKLPNAKQQTEPNAI